MMKVNGIYRCEICGNVVSVLEAAGPDIICCGQEMTLMEEKGIGQEGKEKHVPVIETTEGGLKVKVGSIPHPMEEKHFIELIQVLRDDNIVVGKRLKPGDKPEAEFCLANVEGLRARILCNIHGLWKS
jgi:superoxide reductase